MDNEALILEALVLLMDDAVSTGQHGLRLERQLRGDSEYVRLRERQITRLSEMADHIQEARYPPTRPRRQSSES